MAGSVGATGATGQMNAAAASTIAPPTGPCGGLRGKGAYDVRVCTLLVLAFL